MTLQKGLVAHYELEELPAKDSSAYDNDMSTTGNPQLITGQVNGGVSFDGNDYLSVNKKFYDGDTKGSLCAWFKTSVTGTFQGIAASNADLGSETGGFILRTTDQEEISCVINGGQGARIDANGTNVTDNVWHHAVATYDGSQVRLYLDGTEVANTSYSKAVSDMAPFFVGTYQWDDNNDGFSEAGQVDDVRVYNRALSQAEAEQLTSVRNKRRRQA